MNARCSTHLPAFRRSFSPLVAALLMIPCAVFSQESFSIEWSAIDGGGGLTGGAGEFSITGSSIGQFAAGDPDGGPPGEFDITGGYWTFELEPPVDRNLTMQLDGGTVTLTWDAGASPVVLESSADLELWGPVDPQPAGPPFAEPSGQRRFYRLVPAE